MAWYTLHGQPMFGSLPPGEAEAMEQQWQAFQEAIAAQSASSQIVVAENSGHLVQMQAPAVIVEAVQQTLGRCATPGEGLAPKGKTRQAIR